MSARLTKQFLQKVRSGGNDKKGRRSTGSAGGEARRKGKRSSKAELQSTSNKKRKKKGQTRPARDQKGNFLQLAKLEKQQSDQTETNIGLMMYRPKEADRKTHAMLEILKKTQAFGGNEDKDEDSDDDDDDTGMFEF